MTTFSELKLAKPIIDALHDKGYNIPTPIQVQAIPAIIKGRDVMAAAQTGSGKTAGFTLPVLHRLTQGKAVDSNCVRVLILVPTRELAAQVEESVQQYGKNLALRYAVVFGGVKINPQMKRLRAGVDILVATPGRLMDLHNQNAVRFNQVETLILDEADRMLDMGFINDIRKILALLPKTRQNLMFSATFSDEIRQLARGILSNPVEIDVSPRNSTTHSVKQLMHPVDKKKKTALLKHLISENKWQQVLVFTRTKRGANQLCTQLERSDIKAAAIHGDKSQGSRTRALDEFKKGIASVLIATDLAARGIDITDLPHVVNFDLPDSAENYVHRIGRTGRAGKKGEAISLVCADEIDQLSDIESLIGKKIPREYVGGFEPVHEVPVRELKALKKKRPKKPKNKDGSQATKGAPKQTPKSAPKKAPKGAPHKSRTQKKPRPNRKKGQS
ncbi:MAG: DEAD/DEAH box helicase [Gammaproteobacteria bacterium]|nr:DEAD/DEAH box helicase [Gammaproteobacteria bacterium]